MRSSSADVIPYLDGVLDGQGTLVPRPMGSVWYYSSTPDQARPEVLFRLSSRWRNELSALSAHYQLIFKLIFNSVQMKLENAVQVKQTVAVFQCFLKNLVAKFASLRNYYLFSGYQVSFSSRACVLLDTFRRWCDP